MTRAANWETAQASALFASKLSARCRHSDAQLVAAIGHAIRSHDGVLGCVGEVAAAYGQHPETAARRMRWAREVIERMRNVPDDAGVSHR
jgi:hypothetical protein